jgi:hypothetical protein
MPTSLLAKRERRRWKRHWFNGSIQVVQGGHSIAGLGIQVSQGGMYLFAIADLPVGSEIEIAFTAPDSREPIRLSGAVRHRAVYLYGVEFLPEEHDGAADERLQAFLNQSGDRLSQSAQ